MPAPATVAEFLDLVRKSGVTEEKKLDTYLETLRAQPGTPTTPPTLAERMVRDGQLTNFQAEQLLLGKWKRFFLGKYKVLERLGSGGMGSVYLCEHKLMRRRVAVKVLPPAKAEDQASLERFYREAKVIAALDHPNIVRAYDIDQEEKLHFLVMEHVDGISLQDLVKKAGPMDVERAAHYMRQAALGLQHAHEVVGIVHRDIKPGNILVDRNGLVKILDMGLARFFHDEEDMLTKKYDENVLGTADYLAPEQALDSHAVDIRADIYSLGATFYTCLTGRTPFVEGSTAQKLIWHQTRQPKPLQSLRSDVPEGLVAVVNKMMAKDPADRYQTPAEVAEALAPWTQNPVPPPPAEALPRLSPAAMTGVVPSSDSRLASVAPGSGSHKNWRVAGAAVPTPPPTPRTPAPAPAPRQATVAQARASTRPAAGAANNGAVASRSKPAAQTDSQALAETPSKPVAKPKPAPAASESGWKRWLIIAIVAIVVVALVFTLSMFVFNGLDWMKKGHSAERRQETVAVMQDKQVLRPSY